MTYSKTSSSPNRIFGSIRSQLVLGFGLILILALVIAIIGYQSLQSLRTSVQTTLEEASQIRELSLEIENVFLQARQDESSFLATWRSLGFEAAQVEYVSENELHLEQARSKFNEFEKIVQNSGDTELMHTLDDSVNLIPLLDTYESAFQAVVTAIEQRSRPDGQENTMFATLNQLEAMVSPLPDPELLQLVFQIRADEQAYLNTGQRQYYDNLRLLIVEFTDRVQNSSQANLPDEAASIPASASDPQEETVPLSAPEELVEIPISEILELIGIYQENLTELVTIEGSIDVNTTVFREVTVEINELTDQILQEGEAGFTRARDQLQSVSDQNRLALVLVSVLALGLGSLAAFALARRIIGPLNQLSDTAQRLGQGDLTQSVQITGGTELVTLANSFNTMTAQLRDLIGGLEERVAERTAELEKSSAQTQKRASQLETIADVASSVASLQSVDQLLPYITQTVSEHFGFYHAGIFLLSKNKDYAVLHAANSEGGQAMLARKHQLRVGHEGIVGSVVAQKTARIALDVGSDATYFDNPDLPNTHSEIALPLMIGNEVIGVLDVQSEETNAFSEEDIEVLTTLANQVAVAIENARLFQQSQDTLLELDTTFQRYMQNEWSRFGNLSDVIGYRARPTGLEAINQPLQKDSKTVNNDSVYKLPVKLRNIVIGYLDVDLDKPVAQYTEDELEIIQTTVDRFALALENARLLEDTTRRAGRERLVSEITTKIRSTNDPQVMIQIALDELKEALGASKIELTTEFPNPGKAEDIKEN